MVTLPERDLPDMKLLWRVWRDWRMALLSYAILPEMSLPNVTFPTPQDTITIEIDRP